MTCYMKLQMITYLILGLYKKRAQKSPTKNIRLFNYNIKLGGIEVNSLYELTSDLKELQEIDFMDAEADEIEEIKAIIKEQIATKGTGIILVVRNLESDVEAIKAEIKRLQDLKKSKENKIENLKKYTKECLEEADIKKVSTSLGNISIRKLPGSVEVLEENSIPQEYKKEVITVTIDKKAILAELKEGVVIPGVTLKTGTSLTIK